MGPLTPVASPRVTVRPWSGEHKRLARHLAAGPGPDGVARTALFLPAGGLNCVREALRQGCIDEKTRCIFVERDAGVRRRLRRAAARLNWRFPPQIISGQLEDLELAAYLDDRPLEYAFLDICSPLDRRMFAWLLTELSPVLGDQFAVSVTASRSFRRRLDVPRLYDYLWQHNAAVVSRAHQLLREAPRGGNLMSLDCPWFQLPRLGHMRHYLDVVGLCPIPPVFHETSVKNLCFLLLALNEHQPRVTGCLEYGQHRGTRMSLIRLESGGTSIPVKDRTYTWLARWLAQEPADQTTATG